MIKAIPGIKFEEMEYNREDAHCCGSVLTLLKEPLVAHDVGDIRIKEAEEIDAEAILALCPPVVSFNSVSVRTKRVKL